MSATRTAIRKASSQRLSQPPRLPLTMEIKTMLTQERLKELLTYNPETGIFTKNSTGTSLGWQIKPSKCSYIQMSVDGKKYLAHRLAWLYMTGSFPKDQIDHIDGNGLNNVFTNLRDVDTKTNCKNKSLSTKNKSGKTGVYWHKKAGKWAAQIQSGKVIFLGYFDDLNQAITARVEAENRYGFHKNHGAAR